MSLFVLVMAWSLCTRGAAAENGNSTEPWLRLVDGHSRCQGRLQLDRVGLDVQRAGLQVQGAEQDWTEVKPWPYAPLWFVNRVCAELDCGSALGVEKKTVSNREAVYLDPDRCLDSSLIDCFESDKRRSDISLELNCSDPYTSLTQLQAEDAGASCQQSVNLSLQDSVRLVGGSLCSGSLQIQDQSWAGVCERALDRRAAEVLCRELHCGAPLLQRALSPLRPMFHCEGNESKLMDCPQTRTGPVTCPTLNLTCTEPLRLVGGASRCEGTVEAELGGVWRRVMTSDHWDLEAAAAVCRDLDCGSAISTKERAGFNKRKVWAIGTVCVKKSAAVRDCVEGVSSRRSSLLVICSELLNGDPEVSVSEGVWAPRAEGSVWAPRAQEGDWAPRGEGGVWVQMGAHFRVKCSVEPQYPGGSFQLLSPTLNLTLPAVNHSAHFLFTDVGRAHKGNYTCVYLLQVFKHNFTSTSSLYIHPGVSDFQTFVRALVLLLLMPLNFIPYFFYRQAIRGHERAQRARRRRARPEEECTDVVFDQM